MCGLGRAKKYNKKMKSLRWLWLLLGLSACMHPSAPPHPAPMPIPVQKPAQAPAPTVTPPAVPDSMACRQACRTRLLNCQDTPAACDQLYSDCLSRC